MPAAAASPWEQKLAATRLLKAVKRRMLETYDEEDLLATCFRKECDLDAWIKSLLVTESNPVAAEDSWNVRPVAGMIRRLWLDACGQSSSGVGVEAKQQSTPASLSLLPLSGSGQRLDAAERDKLRKMFEGNYPRTVINGATLPCLGFLSCVKAQCSARAWEWIPWKKGLSEGDSLAVKSRKGKSGDLLEIMSQAAGLGQDEWDLDLSNAPLRVTSILTVRAHAYCMCGVGHLSSWMQYVQKFVSHYTKPAGDGFRMPTAIEAEMADREVVGEVFRMVYDGVSMDRALLSVVKDDLLRIHLFCKPKPFKQRKGNQGAGGAVAGRPPAGDSILNRKRPLPRNPGGRRNTRCATARFSRGQVPPG